MGPHPRPYDGMSDEELLAYAKTAMLAAAAEPPGTIERAMRFAAYDSIMNELARRLMSQWAANISEKLGLPPPGLLQAALGDALLVVVDLGDKGLV